MPIFVFSVAAQRKLHKLDGQIQNRILKKLADLKEADDRRSMTMMTDADPATHRLRIGDYRLIFQQKDQERFLVMDIGHRSQIYR